MTMDRELGWDKAPTVREIEKLDDITSFGKFSKLRWKKILFTSVDSFIRLFYQGRVYPAGKNFIGKINPDVILPVKLKSYRQNKSCSYSAGKT